MIVCPRCHHSEIEGAFFCSQCGSRLYLQTAPSLLEIAKTPVNHAPSSTDADVVPPQVKERARINVSLECLSTGRTIPLEGEGEFLVGRFDESQAVQPNVDLTSLGGYEAGVSRTHAMIRIGREVSIVDLGSVNGTRINGVKITPHTTHVLSGGEILTFGKLQLRITLHR